MPAPILFEELIRFSQEHCEICGFPATGITARAKGEAIDDHVRYVNTRLLHEPNDPHFDEARIDALVVR